MKYSLLAGICFGASLFLLVLYMPKYNNKQLIRALIVWTVMATMCGAGFVSAFSSTPAPTVSIASPTTAPTPVPSARVTPEPSVTPSPALTSSRYFSTDPVKFHRDYAAKNSDDNLTDVQMDDYKKQFSDKLVKWSGAVKDVSYTSDGESICIDLTSGEISFTVFFSESCDMDTLKKIAKGQKIVVEGTTRYFVDWYLDDARMLEE